MGLAAIAVVAAALLACRALLACACRCARGCRRWPTPSGAWTRGGWRRGGTDRVHRGGFARRHAVDGARARAQRVARGTPRPEVGARCASRPAGPRPWRRPSSGASGSTASTRSCTAPPTIRRRAPSVMGLLPPRSAVLAPRANIASDVDWLADAPFVDVDCDLEASFVPLLLGWDLARSTWMRRSL